ncbi:MAG: anthranilate synthase component I family protein [Desulfomicrobium apsheronum]|nr:anthranilate synthase component I family protein [Desulfomicrobium apsheronum]
MICFLYSFPLDHFDPLIIYQRLYPTGPGFLESPQTASGTARFSIVPLRRRESYRLDGSGLERIENGRTTPLPGDPFVTLDAILNQRKLSSDTFQLPFAGGFFGFLGYDLAMHIENLPCIARRDRNIPVLWLDWIDLAAIFDHHQQILTLVSLDPRDNLEQWERAIRQALRQPAADTQPFRVSCPAPGMEQQAFEERVRRAKHYIARGDIYQANLSVRFDSRCDISAIDLYRRLRRINPSPFAALLHTPHLDIISASPERLIRLQNGIAETRPIAGTRPRGESAPDDERLRQELLANPKERAEHIMLLDLERNDLGKVCQPFSVEVDELMVLERYSHVTHIVSNVKGRLRKNVGPFALLRAVFPGGTITGAPKKRCMEIIEELEPTGRGTYTGSAGYVSITGNMDFNILIRSFQKFDRELTYQVGAGIVADSDPTREWQECLHKAAALRLALGLAS